MDFNILERRLVRAIRGKRSQGMLNQRLGYGFNQVSRWETGRKRISWDEFCRFCSACRVDLKPTLSRALDYRDAPERADLLVRHLLEIPERGARSEVLRLSPAKISRWKNGKTCPNTSDVLRILSVGGPLLETFLGGIGALDELCAQFPELGRQAKANQLSLLDPGITFVQLCIDLDDYRALKRHVPGFFAKKLGISMEDEGRILALLEEAGLVEWAAGKYACRSPDINTRHLVKDVLRRKLRLQELMREKLNQSSLAADETISTFFAFSCSQEALKEINGEYWKFFQTVKKIALKDQPREKVHMLSVLLLPMT